MLRHDKEQFFSSPVQGKKVWTGTACRVHDKSKGDALVYPKADGSASYEYRTLAELEKIAKQLNTGMIPIRVQHGDENVGRVTSAIVEDGLCKVKFAFDSKVRNAGQLVRDYPELSLGYQTDVRGDGHHINTRVLELSICERARCGAACKINVDGKRADCGSCASCTKTARAVADALALREADLEMEANVILDLMDRAPRADEKSEDCDCDEDTDPEDRCPDCDDEDSENMDGHSGEPSTDLAVAVKRNALRSSQAWMTKK